MKTVTVGQAFSALGVLGTNTAWDQIPCDLLQRITDDPKGFGKNFTAFLNNGARLTIIGEHIIDCSAQPFVPEGWTVEEHRKGGQLKWNPAEVAFYFSESQKGGNYIEGNKLRKELAKMSVKNANVLDYLLANPTLIPEDWKVDENGNTRYIYFWGTIYRDSDGGLCVRYLYWRAGEWQWHCLYLGSLWRSNDPAAVSASKS